MPDRLIGSEQGGAAVSNHSAERRVLVLLATHNGARYLREQLDSILGQQGVAVRVVASDDGSTDATPSLLADAAADPRVSVLPPGRFGTPQANFLRLLRDADLADADAVALADQDDIWHADKLARQLELLDRHAVDATSSNVTAFWERPDGSRRREVIDKAQPQRELDFLLESAGPGCTFLLRSTAFLSVRDVLTTHPLVDPSVPHDWLIYAVTRALGLRWRIDATPTMDYRQHDRNATGANRGVRPALVRARRMASGAYRMQALAVARLTAAVATPALRPQLERIAPLFERSTFASRAALRRLVPELRRAPGERRLLHIALRLGTW
ncbi:glycosyltransferase [Agrococcus sp. Ld7]|uniref:glycosyltransferase n=1 Tax=Agrococcus sp. Ld7 TaxID=649148 RepID=UPI003862FB44